MNKTFIIAEMSGNHNGDIQRAKEIIKIAKEVGADAVKLQTYTADSLTLNCDGEDFVEKGVLWKGMRSYDLYTQAHTPWEWHEELFDYARSLDLVCFSTPFDFAAVDLLESLDNPIYKIASFEITDVNLIKYAASKGKPMIISTGVSTMDDLKLALDVCHEVGNNDITFLKCTSSYPAPLDKANLRTIPYLAERFGVKVGVSDHSLTDTIPTTAVALGATVVEKHLMIDRKLGGPDSGFSLEPAEFERMVKAIRDVESALGTIYCPTDITQIVGRHSCRSLYVAEDMKAGDIITEKNVRSVRPGYGLHPKYLKEILGKKVNLDLVKGTRMLLEFIE